ncbi:RNA-binding cell elongation regulator Jag/EloR [Enterococcus dongliensis]|uniref:RNA-binding protein KhpB n=1 Tax=Enterococcus dongliensis TaxID=2559925 RepID=A0AAP5KQ12_9ENTE|nr:RNA-binding cell elongation regulator Jag/EloR [Enterococcus dongliensis]MDT2596355.1 RNA-binding cell elongation regulator Jag/EloR [Enterococcus dongliensis]MDT2603801.1 RNA-binding cell elongation regulator Jag/EloR [Enterococcus dongliensis]MDT2634046.1 RNA-binding cell elongation regulator Jag/EloR [Enterococcus dongliensis]MDT2636976.1 RNA-binding cell elongation regulator Jag/EloR [Enterococcus dongliensis]MDT2642261.1 RNA-binding cell elongation regulator Jag/EloR [Enterococcus dong
MPVYEGPTIDEAIAQGLHALGLKKEAATIEILTDAKKGFLGMGKKAARVSIEPIEIEEAPVLEPETEEVAAEAEESNPEPVKATEEVDHLEDLEKEDAIKELALYLTNITNDMGVPALVKIQQEANGLIVMNLETSKQGMLIGKHGKILNALQYLAQVFLHRIAKEKLSVVVNVGNYRQKREEVLTRLAQRTAEKVKETGRPVFLEPMPAFERKMIHSTLSKDDYIKTHSEGEDPYRYLVVEPAKKYF